MNCFGSTVNRVDNTNYTARGIISSNKSSGAPILTAKNAKTIRKERKGYAIKN